MQEGFPYKKKITNRGFTLGTSNGGRYFYVLAFTNSPRALLCIDSELLTAANYAGVGVWTVSPIVADITISDNPTSLVYRADLQQVWVVGHYGSPTKPFITIVDANPDSAIFNTVLSTETSLITTNLTTSSAYDYVNNVLFIGGDSNVLVAWRFNADGTTQSVERLSLFPRARIVIFDTSIANFLACDETQGIYFYDFSVVNSDAIICRKCIVGSNVNPTSTAFSDSNNFYVAFQNAVQIRVFDKNTLSLISSVTIANNRSCKYDKNINYNRLISGSYFTNSISFLECNTLTGGGNLAKGGTISGETGTISIANIQDVAVAVPVGATCQHVHVFDTANKSWIGYLPLGKTIGVSLATGSGGYGAHNGAHVLCKNSI